MLTDSNAVAFNIHICTRHVIIYRLQIPCAINSGSLKPHMTKCEVHQGTCELLSLKGNKSIHMGIHSATYMCT